MRLIENKVLLIGNLGKDPEMKTLDNGNCLIRFRLATNEFYRTGEGKQKKTLWHSVVAWGKLAERMETLLSKGRKVAIEGKLNHYTYDDDSGDTRYVTEVVANDFLLLSKMNSEGPSA